MVWDCAVGWFDPREEVKMAGPVASLNRYGSCFFLSDPISMMIFSNYEIVEVG